MQECFVRGTDEIENCGDFSADESRMTAEILPCENTSCNRKTLQNTKNMSAFCDSCYIIGRHRAGYQGEHAASQNLATKRAAKYRVVRPSGTHRRASNWQSLHKITFLHINNGRSPRELQLGEYWWLKEGLMEQGDLEINEVPNQASMDAKQTSLYAALRFSYMKMRGPTRMGSQAKRTSGNAWP